MSRPMTYRASWHDYCCRCIYMVTLSKRPGVPAFGSIAGDVTVPDSVRIVCSPVGCVIRNQIYSLNRLERAIRVLQYAVMPDHVHILLFVTEPIARPLGQLIARFKIEVNHACGLESVFEEGFNDQIMKSSRSLDQLFRYIRQNPYRLAVRHARPEYFRRLRNVKIGDALCQAYGNPFLLRNPFKSQVVVHRTDDNATRQRNRQQWLHTAANGGILVSPFISQAEKAIRTEAETLGGRFILISEKAFSEREKPTGRDFELCCQGRLLIITSWFGGKSSRPPTSSISRAQCLAMNALAARII